jgi:hypothetical protein
MHSPKPPEPDDERSADVTDLERQADEARHRLADTERKADETLVDVERELRDRTEEQEATAERLLREAREPGPLSQPEADTEEGELPTDESHQ